MSNKVNVGGQAIIEGVMMRSPKSLAVCVRRPTGEIIVTERVWESLWERFTFLRWPFLRGAIVLIESLINGIQALMFSANQAMVAEEAAQKAEKEAKALENDGTRNEVSVSEVPLADASSDDDSVRHEINEEPPMSRWWLIGTIAFSLGFAFLVFKGIPHLLATLLGLSTDSVLFHISDGVIKITMFVAYVLAISFMPDIRRVFQYHGAEHKAIKTYEHGEELIVENARKYSTLHPRCGTSFIIIVLLSSIITFMVVFPFLPQFHPNTWVNALIQIAIKLPLMLPIAGISYEFLRWSAKHMDNPIVGSLVKPGLWLQLITTREPDDEQLEIGLTSLRKALWREQVGANDLDSKEIEIYPSFKDVPF